MPKHVERKKSYSSSVYLEKKDFIMLPTCFSDRDHLYTFRICRGEQPSLVLASDTQLATATSQTTSFQPLWSVTAHNEETLEALIRWVKLRHHLWGAWGRMADDAGRDVLEAHMAKLLEEEPLAAVVCTTIQFPASAREVIIIEYVDRSGGLVEEPLYRHRFRSAAAARSVRDWLMVDDSSEEINYLIAAAYDQGSDLLGELLDNMAAQIGKAARRRRRKVA